jgi:outer membrane putative beta-barrel porin/alpha-amylase
MASMRTYRTGAVLVAAVGLGACAHLGAPGPVVADRPGYTDTPVALPAHAVQLEIGVTDDRTGPAGSRTEYVSVGETLLRLGLGANAELRLFGNSYGVRTFADAATVRGMEDFKFGAKLNLRAKPDSVHSWAPNVALLAATTVPTAATGITAGSAQPEAKLAMNWTTASPFSLYANLAYGTIYNDVGRAGRAWASVASWWSVNSRVSLFAEGLVIGRVSGSGSGTTGNDVDGGVTYLINPRFQFDVRVGRGFGSATSSERFVGAGFARRW